MMDPIDRYSTGPNASLVKAARILTSMGRDTPAQGRTHTSTLAHTHTLHCGQVPCILRHNPGLFLPVYTANRKDFFFNINIINTYS